MQGGESMSQTPEEVNKLLLDMLHQVYKYLRTIDNSNHEYAKIQSMIKEFKTMTGGKK